MTAQRYTLHAGVFEPVIVTKPERSLHLLMNQIHEKKLNILKAVQDVTQWIDNDIGVDSAPSAAQVQVEEATQTIYQPSQRELQNAIFAVIPTEFLNGGVNPALELSKCIAISLRRSYHIRPEVELNKRGTPDDPIFSRIQEKVEERVSDEGLAKHLTGEIFDAVQKVYVPERNNRQRS